jgi:hypothetical protein
MVDAVRYIYVDILERHDKSPGYLDAIDYITNLCVILSCPFSSYFMRIK